MKTYFKIRFPLALVMFLAANGGVIQAQDFQKGSYSVSRPNGDKIVLKFEEGGKFSLTDKDGKIFVAGTYKATKNQIEFTDVKGALASKDAKPGKYEWKLESNTLTFSVVQDESEGRRNGLTRSTWTLEKS